MRVVAHQGEQRGAGGRIEARERLGDKFDLKQFHEVVLRNGAIALYTATLTPLATWALYNGFIAYLLIGTMFGAEFLVRSIVLRDRS